MIFIYIKKINIFTCKYINKRRKTLNLYYKPPTCTKNTKK